MSSTLEHLILQWLRCSPEWQKTPVQTCSLSDSGRCWNKHPSGGSSSSLCGVRKYSLSKAVKEGFSSLVDERLCVEVEFLGSSFCCREYKVEQYHGAGLALIPWIP